MSIFDVLTLLCGLALFLYGMDLMGDGLKRCAGSRLKTILGKMTSNPIKGFLLGLGVTAIIQSSSATTVMVVGFVNSGTMTLLQAAGVIVGANVGTAVTSWLTGLSGLGAGAEAALDIIQWLKPSSWMPILAVIGIILVMFAKSNKKKDIGVILLGFSVLMVGMDLMAGAVGGLKESESFRNLLIMFENPILGVLAGTILTAIVQSSSASVGILQSLTTTGAITFGAAIPIVMGQNIGTCVTAMLSSISANRNGKRAALVHLYFNIIGVVVFLCLFYLADAFVDFTFVDKIIDMWGVAIVHTLFKFFAVATVFPFYKQLVRLSEMTIKDKGDEDDKTSLLDELLINTPAVAVGRATEVTGMMADYAVEAQLKALSLFDQYDSKIAEEVRELEGKADVLEDALGSYLVKIAASDLDEASSAQVTKLLHIIGDFERISDHAVHLVQSVEELRDKKSNFSPEAQEEMAILRKAIAEILELTRTAFKENDLGVATHIEPLEQVVDKLVDRIKLNHILRLQKSECTIQHGFVLSDLLIYFERISDHCSNIGGCIIEISEYNAMDMHKYMAAVHHGSEDYEQMYNEYKYKYSV